MYNLLFWILIQLVLLWSLSWATKGYRNKKVYKILFAPALLLESLCRLVACCFSAKSVERVDFFQDGKPFLTDAKSRIPYFGAAIFVLLWQALVYYTFHAWATDLEGLDCYAVRLPHVDHEELTAGLVEIDGRSYLDGLTAFLRSTRFGWQVLFFLYFSLGLFPFLSVDGRQFRHGAAVLGVLALLTAVFDYLGVKFGFLSRGWYLDGWVLPRLFAVFSLYLTLLACALIIHLGVRTAWGLASRRARANLEKKDRQKKRPAKAKRAERVA